jgi:hypothetical protein
MAKQHGPLRDGVHLHPLNTERTRLFAEVWMLRGNKSEIKNQSNLQVVIDNNRKN